MRLITSIFFIGLVLAACSQHSKKQPIDNSQFITTEVDSQIFQKVIEGVSNEEGNVIGNIILSIGSTFCEKTYSAQTLEQGDTEKLVINLHEFDCTTLVENCIAISRTIKSGDNSFDKYLSELQNVRYRKGVIESYPSRLHYFSDWIYENEQKGIVKDISKELSGIVYPNKVNFMSTHPNSYKHLRNNEIFIEQISQQEKTISSRTDYYIPKKKILEIEKELQNGDIVGITTNIPGLDISHVGILVWEKERIHMLHASSAAKKVIVSEETLEDYLQNNKSATGIMVARPL